MAKLDIDVSQVKKLVELVEAHGLEELTVEENDLSITVRGHAAQVPVVMHAGGTLSHVEHPHEAEEHYEEEPVEEVPEFEGNIHDIVASLVGVFYRAPSPDAPNFIEVGDSIEVGSEVGLIEAMKVFSPIPSEVAGVVVDIPAQNGKLVQQGDVLIRVRLQEESLA